jgi:hypothetical protein
MRPSDRASDHRGLRSPPSRPTRENRRPKAQCGYEPGRRGGSIASGFPFGFCHLGLRNGEKDQGACQFSTCSDCPRVPKWPGLEEDVTNPGGAHWVWHRRAGSPSHPAHARCCLFGKNKGGIRWREKGPSHRERRDFNAGVVGCLVGWSL